MATLPIPDTQARGVREVVQSLRNYYGPKPKRVDGPITLAPPSILSFEHGCPTLIAINDVEHDDGLHPMDRLAWRMFLLTEWLEHPPIWARAAFFAAVVAVVYFDVCAVMILWP